MNSNPLSKAFILVLVLVIGFIVCWEYYWRSQGFTTTHNDDKVLWATRRKEIYSSPERTTVFTGGSRIKFDLDIPTWEKITGDEAVQLALVATPARLILRDLANDKNFKGKVVVDVTEPQFFTLDSMRREKSSREALEYYYGETPAQRTSAFINYPLESNLVFLEEGKFSLNVFLNDLKIPNRPGVFALPSFPKHFGLTTYERQTFMSKRFLSDPQLQNIQRGHWNRLIVSNMDKGPKLDGEPLELFLAQIKKSIDKIKSRGGQVIFVRPPSSGEFLAAEKKVYSRDQYWEKLLAYTNCTGIHFEDYPETAEMICPEDSHLSSIDAVTYTEHLVKVLKNEKGWSFPNLSAATSYNQKP
jgi:hypothetical protein